MKMVVENVHKEEKIKLPKAVPFIVAFAFFHGFGISAYDTILILYLRNQLVYSDDTSTVIFHSVRMLASFLSIFGGIVVDSWLGRFRSIFIMTIIKVVGFSILAISAVTSLHLPDRPLAFVAFGLLIIGAAGITSCTNPFGGDQFDLPLQQRHLSTFFSMLNFSVNFAAAISMFVAPILRQDVACFGEDTCYSLAFFISVLSMLLAIVIFTLGRSTYKINTPKGNVILDVTKCISHAIGNRFRRNRGPQREHWLDYADDKYDRTLITEIRTAFAVLMMFLPLHMFWALMSQQGSRWTIQATRMDGQFGNWLLKPDQMQMLNPLLVMILIPLFATFLYPALEKTSLVITPLRKMAVGGILAGFAFIMSAMVELQLEETYPVIPSNGLAQVRIFNTLNCPIDMSVGGQTFVLDKLSVWENKSIEADGQVSLGYTANYDECIRLGMTPGMKKDTSGTITAIEASAISWVITPTMETMYSYVDNVNRTRTGDPSIRVLLYANESIGSSFSLNFVKDSKTVFSLNISSGFTKTELKTLDFATYRIYLNNELIAPHVELKNGGLYTVTAYVNDLNTVVANIIMITSPNSLHMLWLLPQYFVITVSEVLLAGTATEFAFTQAPVSMKSLIMAFLVSSKAIGDLIVVIVADVCLFTSQASEYFLFAGLMWGDMLIFGIMAMYYKYVDQSDEKLTKDQVHTEQPGAQWDRNPNLRPKVMNAVDSVKSLDSGVFEVADYESEVKI